MEQDDGSVTWGAGAPMEFIINGMTAQFPVPVVCGQTFNIDGEMYMVPETRMVRDADDFMEMLSRGAVNRVLDLMPNRYVSYSEQPAKEARTTEHRQLDVDF